VQDALAGDDHLCPGAAAEQAGQCRRGLKDVLEVVQHQQDAAVAERAGDSLGNKAAVALAHADRVGDRRKNERRVDHPGKGDEDDATGEVSNKLLGDPQRHSGLARAARPRQREQPNLVPPQQLGDLGQFALPRHEARQRHRQGRTQRAGAHGRDHRDPRLRLDSMSAGHASGVVGCGHLLRGPALRRCA
jgi:hypothetical protein